MQEQICQRKEHSFFLASSSEAESDSESESEEGTGTTESSKTPDLSTCPLRSLVHAYEDNEDYEDNSYSPIQPDQSDSGPVDPVFVDEESSGEAVASAGKYSDLSIIRPGLIIYNTPDFEIVLNL